MPITRMTRERFLEESHAFSCHIPLPNLKEPLEEEKLVEYWVNLVKSDPCCGAKLEKVEQEGTSFVRFFFLYHGWAEHHPFQFSTRLVYLTDVKRLVVQSWIEQDVHDLMEVLLRWHLLPSWAEEMGLLPV